MKSTPDLKLIKAAQSCNSELCKELLNNEYDPKIVDENEMTAMMHAARQKNIKTINIISDINQKDQTVVHMKDIHGRTALIYSIIENSPASLKLLEIGIDEDNKFCESFIDYLYSKDNSNKSAIDYLIDSKITIGSMGYSYKSQNVKLAEKIIELEERFNDEIGDFVQEINDDMELDEIFDQQKGPVTNVELRKKFDKGILMRAIKSKNYDLYRAINKEKAKIDLNAIDNDFFSIIDYLIKNNDDDSHEILKEVIKNVLENGNILLSPIEDYELLRLDLMYEEKEGKKYLAELLDSRKFKTDDAKFKLLMKSIINRKIFIIAKMVEKGFIDDIANILPKKFMLSFIKGVYDKSPIEKKNQVYKYLVDKIKDNPDQEVEVREENLNRRNKKEVVVNSNKKDEKAEEIISMMENLSFVEGKNNKILDDLSYIADNIDEISKKNNDQNKTTHKRRALDMNDDNYEEESENNSTTEYITPPGRVVDNMLSGKKRKKVRNRNAQRLIKF